MRGCTGWAVVLLLLALVALAAACSDEASVSSCGGTALTVDAAAVSATVALDALATYHTTLTAGTRYTVSIDTQSGDPDVYVLDICVSNPEQIRTGELDDQIVAAAETDGAFDESLTFTPTRSGTYTIIVHGYSAASYSVRMETGAGNGVTSTSCGGTSLTLDATALSGAVVQGDLCFYSTSLGDYAQSTVTLTPTTGDTHLAVLLGTTVVGLSENSGTVADALTVSTGAGQSYTVVVYGYQSSLFQLASATISSCAASSLPSSNSTTTGFVAIGGTCSYSVAANGSTHNATITATSGALQLESYRPNGFPHTSVVVLNGQTRTLSSSGNGFTGGEMRLAVVGSHIGGTTAGFTLQLTTP